MRKATADTKNQSEKNILEEEIDEDIIAQLMNLGHSLEEII
jgi:hypothetical protein